MNQAWGCCRGGTASAAAEEEDTLRGGRGWGMSGGRGGVLSEQTD